MQAESNWQLIASGDIQAGQDRDKVIEVLKHRLGFNDTYIDKLLNGQKKIIKKNLDQVTAYKYRQALRTAGVDVEIKELRTEINSV
ncbi:MAG: hypothetical protein KZQ58_02185 [gamma proteobacterium symbiont of Bathyaustriella thionipta]|nr:hypothetical protein [gamma proteobacterium symbiont of Bathyaustriella thionipta]